MIHGTIALPVWNSNKIAWLAMESFCRQEKPSEGWELIIFEEIHPTMCGESYFMSYMERLKDVGCEQLTYITSKDKIPLSLKWREIALKADKDSTYFCVCAADNYYSPYLLRDAEEYIKYTDWAIMTKGYFYDFITGIVIKYDYPCFIGLQMVAKTELMRKLPKEEVNKGVDSWLSRSLKPRKVTLDSTDHWEYMLCTHGLNNISMERGKYFVNPGKPFFETDEELINIVPPDIVDMIHKTSNILTHADH